MKARRQNEGLRQCVPGVVAVVAVTTSTCMAQTCERWWPVETNITPAPVARQGLVNDASRDVSVFFTGSIQTGRQTWEYDGKDWSLRLDGKGPQVFGNFGFVFDHLRGCPLLFGGTTLTFPEDSVSIWVEDHWEDLGTQGNAGARWSHSMAYDDHRNVVVVFGGLGDNGMGIFQYRDTIELVGKTWFRRSTTGPSAGGAIAFDSRRGVTVLHGARTPGETWEWNGAAWMLRDIGGGSNHLAATMVYDAHLEVCTLIDGLVAGRLWRWDGDNWSQINPAGLVPPHRQAPAVAYDSRRHRIVMFGGQRDQITYGDTWEYGLYPDCDHTTGAGILDIFDFLCFGNKFGQADPYACNCDTSTGNNICDIFDFLCFQNLFAACQP